MPAADAFIGYLYRMPALDVYIVCLYRMLLSAHLIQAEERRGKKEEDDDPGCHR
jgi:hypothetical protein